MLNDLTFCELKEKETVNVVDGKRLGKILDMAFTPGGQITGIIVPGDRKFLKNITGSDSVFVPPSRAERSPQTFRLRRPPDFCYLPRGCCIAGAGNIPGAANLVCLYLHFLTLFIIHAV